MKIVYKNNSIEKVCTNATVASKKYGVKMADKIHQRIDQLLAVDSINDMIKYNIGRCHPLTGDRKGQYAVDLVHPYRLILEKHETEIKIVQVIEVTDYH